MNERNLRCPSPDPRQSVCETKPGTGTGGARNRRAERSEGNFCDLTYLAPDRLQTSTGSESRFPMLRRGQGRGRGEARVGLGWEEQDRTGQGRGGEGRGEARSELAGTWWGLELMDGVALNLGWARPSFRIVIGGLFSLCWTNVLSMLGLMIGLFHLQLSGLSL